MPEPIAAREMIANSAKHGLLAKELFVIFTSPTYGLGPVLENLEPHLEYQRDLERRGIMFAAGPQWAIDDQHWNGDGMVVIRASSSAEAEAIAAADPMHKLGARTYTIRAWLMNEGMLNARLDFSTGRFVLD